MGRTKAPVRRDAGQSLVIIVFAMFAILAICAFTIDVASWYQKHHAAQVAADAASLAAANCLENAGPGKSCSSTTDSAHAVSVATSYAAANGVPIPTTDVSVSANGSTVTVTTPNPAPSVFAGAFGIASTQTATAAATYTASTTNCTSQAESSGLCLGVFAMANSCLSNGVTFDGKNSSVNGAVWANGSINEIGRGQTLGSVTIGTGCTFNTSSGSTPATASQSAPLTSWPVDYSQDFPACGSGLTYSCAGPGGTPSYCTQAAANYSNSTSFTSSQVWCAYGTGTPSTPSTWNGTIDFPAVGSSSSPLTGTFLAGSINVGVKNAYISNANSSWPVFYAFGSSTSYCAQICAQTQNDVINGALFAPNGGIEFNGAGSTANFLEGQTVDFVGGSFNGIGPTTGSSGTTTVVPDHLTQ